MPGSIHISATQLPVTPLFLQVGVGKREYSGNIDQDGLSFPVTSLRESMVIMLYNADRELISKTELQTKQIVESGTADVVCTLDSGEVILQLQFLLSDDDRKRIQEVRSSAMKRKKQELLGDGYGLNFPDSPLSKRLMEKISNIESKRDQTELRKSLSLEDLQDRAIFSGIINLDSRMKASRDLYEESMGIQALNSYSDLQTISDRPLSERIVEKISNVESKQDQTELRKSLSLEDLHGRAIFSGINLDSRMKASRDLLPQSGSRKFEDPKNDSKKGHGKPESRPISAVKNMISAFESTSSQGILISESGASVTSSSDCKEPDKANGDKDSNYRSRKQVSYLEKPDENGLPTASYESRSHRSSGCDGAVKQQVKEHDLSRSKRRSQAKHRHSIGPFSLEQLDWMGSSRSHLECPLNYLVATSSTWLHPHVCVTTASRELKNLLELEHLSSLTRIKHADESEMAESTGDDELVASSGGCGGFPVLNLKGWWWINQGVRAAIAVVACGAVFLNSR